MVEVSQQVDLQHPLAPNIYTQEGLLQVEEVEDENIKKKSPNSRRRRRGSRRHSSAVPTSNAHETTIKSSPAENDTICMTAPNTNNRQHHQHKRSTAIGKHTKQNINFKKKQGEEETPAFQSLVDIIREMKRLPSISITTDKQENQEEDEKDINGSWKRVRRHSEPPHKMKQHQNQVEFLKKSLRTINEQKDMLHEKPIFSNSFLALEDADDDVLLEGENNIETLVSPLSNNAAIKAHLISPLRPPGKRTRSKSVPNNLLPLPQDYHITTSTTTTRKALYPAHLTVTEASTAIRARKLFSGILRVDIQDSSEAFVECEELGGASIYIFGSRNRNRALDGDEVAIELVDVDDMLNEKQTKRQARHTRRLSCITSSSNSVTTTTLSSSHPTLSSIPEINNDLDDLSVNRPRPKYCGKVVCILERPRNMLFSGTLSLYRPHAKTLDNGSRDKKESHSPKIIWFIPADKRLPLVAVPIKHAPADFIKYHEEYKNRIFAGSIQRWPVTSLHPFGLIEKEIGWVGELDVHSGALMADHHIKDIEFSEAVQKAAAAVSSKITDEDRKGRRDLTKKEENLTVFTMGKSSNTADIDHAFSISNSPEKGIFEIGIHVSDVSNYIRVNTPLDREARDRSCSVQLVDKKITILPESFTESHCSLGAVGTERLAFSVLCRFTEKGVLLHAWIGKTIIKSSGHVQLPATNEHHQQMVGEDGLKEDAKSILKLCQKLQHNRSRKLNGTSLAKSIELFKLADSGYPEEIERVNGSDGDVLLEELLIVANIEVGQKISSRFPDQALLYRQDVPKMSKLALVQDYFENEPLTDTVNGLLKLVEEKETAFGKQEALEYVIRQATPTSKYFSAGSLDISKYQHAGFGASICTMFTEPLHNYASVHVQRQLTAALKGEEQNSDNFDVIDKIARHCNSSHLSKTAAEQDSKKLYTAAYIYRQCLNAEVKKVYVEAFAIHFDTDLVHLYIPEYDLELPVIMNEKSVPGGHHVYDSTLNEMEIIWQQKITADDEREEEDVIIQRLKFLSSVEIGIRVDMKVVRPIFEIEFLK